MLVISRSYSRRINHRYVDDEDREDVDGYELTLDAYANGNEHGQGYFAWDDDCDDCRYGDVNVDDSYFGADGDGYVDLGIKPESK